MPVSLKNVLTKAIKITNFIKARSLRTHNFNISLHKVFQLYTKE